MTDKFNHMSAWCQMKYKGTINHSSAWCQMKGKFNKLEERQIKPYISMVSKRGKLNHTSAWCQKGAN